MSDEKKAELTTRSEGLLRQAMAGLKRHRWGWAALWVLALLAVAALFAEFLAPYDPFEENRGKSYHPPSAIRFVDAEGRWHWRPFVYETRLADPIFKTYAPETSRPYPIRLFVEGSPYRLLGVFPLNVRLFGVEAPARIFLFGTDLHGRDLFSRLLFGARISLSIGLIGVALTYALGLLLGGVAGYYGRWVDHLLMRLTEVIMSVPTIYLLLAIRAVFPVTLTSVEIYLLIVLAMSFISWAGLARVIRGMVLSIKEQEFVLAARALGAGDLRIILRHILPNTFSYTIIALTLAVPGFILAESALSFLSLGIQEPYPSWGNMLTAAMSVRVLTTAPWVLIPGAWIAFTIVSFNFLGDGLRDALDPRFKA